MGASLHRAPARGSFGWPLALAAVAVSVDGGGLPRAHALQPPMIVADATVSSSARQAFTPQDSGFAVAGVALCLTPNHASARSTSASSNASTAPNANMK